MPLEHQGKRNHNIGGLGWIAVLRLFRNIGWDEMGTSSGENYWKLTAFRRNSANGARIWWRHYLKDILLFRAIKPRGE
jgi:hypothetical protein